MSNLLGVCEGRDFLRWFKLLEGGPKIFFTPILILKRVRITLVLATLLSRAV